MGGTIDKAYPKAVGAYAFDIDEPASKNIVQTLNPSFSYSFVSICKKDSQDITNDDLESLQKCLLNLNEQHIVITHGTDTMIQTGLYLAALSLEKTIVMTGASKPAAFKDSDASTQVGTAITASQLLPFGVYIAMHGTVKKVENISRDLTTGKFI